MLVFSHTQKVGNDKCIVDLWCIFFSTCTVQNKKKKQQTCKTNNWFTYFFSYTMFQYKNGMNTTGHPIKFIFVCLLYADQSTNPLLYLIFTLNKL
jgi:hypothetical protein